MPPCIPGSMLSSERTRVTLVPSTAVIFPARIVPEAVCAGAVSGPFAGVCAEALCEAAASAAAVSPLEAVVQPDKQPTARAAAVIRARMVLIFMVIAPF